MASLWPSTTTKAGCEPGNKSESGMSDKPNGQTLRQGLMRKLRNLIRRERRSGERNPHMRSYGKTPDPALMGGVACCLGMPRTLKLRKDPLGPGLVDGFKRIDGKSPSRLDSDLRFLLPPCWLAQYSCHVVLCGCGGRLASRSAKRRERVRFRREKLQTSLL